MRTLLALCLLLPALAVAETAMSSADFIAQAAADAIAEVEAGRMAQSTATAAPPVQQLGRQIGVEAVQKHERLVQLAESRGLHLGNQISASDRATLERLSRLRGAAFSRDYLRHVMAALEHQRALFQVAQVLDDHALSQFARDSLPTIENQLMVARAVYDSQIAGMPDR
ncbi:MAG: DUF4142 domain-containing protein [Bacteroidales bacterium]